MAAIEAENDSEFKAHVFSSSSEVKTHNPIFLGLRFYCCRKLMYSFFLCS